MKLKKNEIILISILGILIFCFVFYKFIWTPVLPKIGEQKDVITKLETEKQNLDNDLSNINSKKIELVSKQAADERIAGYLSDEGNMVDCIEYIDKLSEIIGKNITDVSVSEPELKEVNKSKYYKINMEFTTVVDVNEIKNMLGYIENSSKLIDISSFKLSEPKLESLKSEAVKEIVKEAVNQLSKKGITSASEVAMPLDDNYEATLSLNMYSLNLTAADRICEYSRFKFNQYNYSNQSPFVGGTLDLDSKLPEDKSTIPENTSSNSSNADDKVNKKDIEIRYNSFLSAGDNFMILGYDKSKDKIMVKTNKYITIEMSIGNTSFTVKATDSSGKTYKMSRSIPNRDLNMSIDINLPDIQENKDSGLKIIVVNGSNNKIGITFNNESGKVTLTDRDGTVISSVSDKEKVSIN